jgi:outer membrane protein
MTLASVLTFAHAARAQDEPHGIKRTGLELGARVPIAFPLGDAQKNVELSDEIAWQVPLQLDVGYREETMTFGLYAGYGFAKVGRPAQATCDVPGVNCSAYSIRAGIQFIRHFAPKRPIGGWMSAGIGFEKIGMTAGVENADANVSASYVGLEFASLQAGLDFRSKSGFGLGPYMGLLPGRYLDASIACSGRDCPSVPGASISETTFHYWIVVGVRGALLL